MGYELTVLHMWKELIYPAYLEAVKMKIANDFHNHHKHSSIFTR